MNNYIKHLNNSQAEAVTYNDGHLLVIAGAGTGKTRVITYKIAYLIQNMQVAPSRILAVTFTNKAANEMKKRVEHIVEDVGNEIWIGTFHSVALKILRDRGYVINMPKGFGVIDQDDRMAVLRDTLKRLDIDSKKYPPKMYLTAISNFKNTFEYVDELTINCPEYRFGDVFSVYQAYLSDSKLIDFDDMLALVIRLFRRNSDIAELYRRHFMNILVDEFQDTNSVQLEFIKLITGSDAKLCVVGDDDQLIYTWRGSELKNILEFESHFNKAKIVKLTKNYRSGSEILSVANQLIMNNRYRKGKDLTSELMFSGEIQYKDTECESDEAKYVSDRILDLMKYSKAEVSYDDFAVLYRANYQSRQFEVYFNRFNIPHTVVGSISFYQRREVKDILAYLRFYSNSYDYPSFIRSVKNPSRGIGDTTIEKIVRYASENKLDVISSLRNLAGSFSKRQKDSVSAYLAIFDGFPKDSISEMISYVVKSVQYEEYLKQFEEDNISDKKIFNISELINSAVEYEKNEPEGNLDDFLANSILKTSSDESSEGRVKLMTIHAAKGLEFDTVFLTGLEDGVFPFARAFDSEMQMEEERRLCYVGITRAKRKLFLSSSKSRMSGGKIQVLEPSIFLREMGVFKKQEHGGFFSKLIDSVSSFKNNIDSLPSSESVSISRKGIGSKINVYHDKFGYGSVAVIEGDGDLARITVDFDKFGRKIIVKKFLKYL